MLYLYVKTHRQTRLKYFGKTTRHDPHSYRGSGKHWRRHIKKHGYDVETEIVGEFENLEEGMKYALKFSKENNIIESDEWANLILENGLDGKPKGTCMSKETKLKLSGPNLNRRKPRSKPMSEEHKKNLSLACKGKQKPNVSKALSREWLIIFPNGNKQIISNLRNFCLENNLNPGLLNAVANHKNGRTQHKGFKCEKVERNGQDRKQEHEDGVG